MRFSVFLIFGAAASAAFAPLEKRVTQDVYNTLVYYFKYASSAYTTNCPSPHSGKHLVMNFSNSTTDTQGFIARDDLRKEIVVAFRGSTNAKDAATLANDALVPLKITGYSGTFSGTHVHKGFLAAYNSVAVTIQNSVKSIHAQSAYSGYNIVTVGHDIGGALASIGGVALNHVIVGVETHIYTYGQPRTGDLQYAYLIQETLDYFVFRATHGNDGVVNIPATSKGYTHHGIEYWQNPDPPSPATTKQCQEFGEDPSCSISVSSGGNNAAHKTYFGIPYNQAFCTKA